MTSPASQAQARTLLLHDGELGDVCALLGDLGSPPVERRGALRAGDTPEDFELVIATPQRLLALELPQGQLLPRRIAICDSDSRGLRSSLQRAGIQIMVRRPVHPAALRALLLHALYRGPEKRRTVRVAIGAQVRFRAGWRRRQAILADLSIGGCRLLAPRAAEPGRAIKLTIPPEVTGSKGCALRARVLRRWSEDDAHVLTARFENLRPRQLAQLRRTIEAHAGGPARLEDAPPAHSSAPPTATAHGVPPCDEAASTPAADGERRASPRHTLERRVIALGEEASRVLMGRDISLGGMRVNPNPLLAVGDDVRLAIHTGEQTQPLVVTARVHRDDGDRGMVLRFHALAPDASRTLDRLLDTLPLVDPGAGADAAAGMLVTEILSEVGRAT